MTLRLPRLAALIAIATLVAAASLSSFAESYRGLFLWASHHGLSGFWAAIFPLMIDSFILTGELALFVALVERWPDATRYPAWGVTGLGLAVSIAGNVGHVASDALTWRLTAAIPPVAAAATLAVGLGVLKRIIVASAETEPEPEDEWYPENNIDAAYEALRQTTAAGNPVSQNALAERYGLTRAQSRQVVTALHAASNGHAGIESVETPAGSARLTT